MKCGLEGCPGSLVGSSEFVSPPDVGFAAVFEVFAECVEAMFIWGVVFELRALQF